jgi:Zn-dependent protease with chaperone function
MSDFYMMEKWFGAFAFDYGEKGSTTKSCQVSPTPTGINLKIGEDNLSLQSGDLEFSYGGENSSKVMIKVHTPRQSFSLMVKDKKFIKPWKEMVLGPDMEAKLADLLVDKGKKQLRGLSWVIGFFLLIGLGYWGVSAAYSAAVKTAAKAIPQDLQARLGDVGAYSIMSETNLFEHPEAEALLEELGSRLETHLTLAEQAIDFEYFIIDQPDINAFALPGGKIFFHRGLFENAGSVDEIAGVLAHEMIHITESHGLQNLINSIGMSVAINIFFGDIRGLQGVLLDNAAALGALNYSREHETEADLKGLELVYAAGLDPEGMVSFFEKILEFSGSNAAMEWFSTHPDTKNRIDELKRIIDEKGEVPAPWVDKPALDLALSTGRPGSYFQRVNRD